MLAFALARGQARLLFEHVGPLLIKFQVSQLQAARPLVKELAAGVPESDDQFANRIAMNASNSLGAADTRPLDQEPQDLDADGGPSKFLTIRTADAEREAYRQAAERAGVPLSEWIRERLNKAAKRESKRD